MTRPVFGEARKPLGHPATTRLLQRLSDDHSTEKLGPRQCCADAGIVLACDGETDFWECRVCGRQWEAPCR